MKTMKDPSASSGIRRNGAAAQFLEDQLALGRVAFPLEELVTATGLSRIAAKFQLLRLGPRVVRVSPRQSFFLIVGPEHRILGAPPPAGWLQAYFDWLGRPYYLALQSAAGLYGSNPQAIQVTQVMTDRPIRPIHLGRIRIRFTVKRHIGRTPTLQPVGAVAPIRVSSPEATAYDLIRHAGSIGGIERASETLRPMVPRLRRRELRRVLEAEGEVSVAQRLGFVLETFGGEGLAKVVADWLPARPATVRLSSSEGDRDSRHRRIGRWRVLDNSHGIDP